MKYKKIKKVFLGLGLVILYLNIYGCSFLTNSLIDEKESLLKNCAIKGAVYDSFNEPVKNAEIKVFPTARLPQINTNNIETPEYTHIITEYSKVDGSFSLNNLSAGNYSLLITAPTGLTAKRENIVVAAGQAINLGALILTSTGEIRGKIRLSNIQNYLGSMVYIPGTLYMTITNPEGEFILYNVPEGKYSINISHTGYYNRIIENISVKSQQVATLDEVWLEPVPKYSLQQPYETSITDTSAVWITGFGIPGKNVGVNENLFLDTSFGNVYKKIDGVWLLIANINDTSTSNVIEKFVTSNNTVSNNVVTHWFNGTEFPSDKLGVKDDYYMNFLTGDIFIKTTDKWELMVNVKGITSNVKIEATKWFNGDVLPEASLGVNDDYYIYNPTGDLYNKKNNVWVIIGNIKGSSGVEGIKGADGTKWYNGDSMPDNNIGIYGDYFLNNSSGDLFTKTANGWQYIGNTLGQKGEKGDPGTKWYNGESMPKSSLGNNGDYYLHNPSGQLFNKLNGVWSLIGNLAGSSGEVGIKGDDGTKWYNGTTMPENTLGVLGDYYLNNNSGDLFVKVGSGWQYIGSTLGQTGEKGEAGSKWYDGNIVPDRGLGVNGDYYLNKITGDIYTKIGNIWQMVSNVKGPKGKTGETGETGETGKKGETGPTGNAGPVTQNIYVDINSSSAIEDGSMANPYKTVRKAFYNANERDWINIAAGTYIENSTLNFNKPLTLIGAGITTKIKLSKAGYLINTYDDIKLKNIVMEGKINGSSNKIEIENCELNQGIRVNYAYLLISNSTIKSDDIGIEAGNNSYIVMLNSNIKNNFYAFYLYQDSTGQISGTNITNNTYFTFQFNPTNLFFNYCYFAGNNGAASTIVDDSFGITLDTVGDGITSTSSTANVQQFVDVDGVANPRNIPN